MSCSDLKLRILYQDISPNNGHQGNISYWKPLLSLHDWYFLQYFHSVYIHIMENEYCINQVKPITLMDYMDATISLYCQPFKCQSHTYTRHWTSLYLQMPWHLTVPCHQVPCCLSTHSSFLHVRPLMILNPFSTAFKIDEYSWNIVAIRELPNEEITIKQSDSLGLSMGFPHGAIRTQ